MAKKKGNGGKPKQSVQAVPAAAMYDPEERLAAAVSLGQTGIQGVQDGGDMELAYAQLTDGCLQIEQILKDGARAGLFDDSQSESGLRGKQYREWVGDQCKAELAVLYKWMADCALSLQRTEDFMQHVSDMIAFAEKADHACRTRETRETLLTNLAAAGDWLVNRLDPPDPKRAFQYGFKLLRLAEQRETYDFEMDEALLPLMKRAAGTIYDSVVWDRSLTKGLNESFAGVIPQAMAQYDQQHILIYADLEANLLDRMFGFGEVWRGPWMRDGIVSFERVYTYTVRQLVTDGIMVEDERFRWRVLRLLGRMQDGHAQLDLTKDILEYCSEHRSEEDLENIVPLAEDIREAVTWEGKYNCQPIVWLYAQMGLSDAYMQSGRYGEAEPIVVETLEDIAEMRQENCPVMKWDFKRIRDSRVVKLSGSFIDLMEAFTWFKRAMIANHLDQQEDLAVYLDRAETALNRHVETDYISPDLRQQIREYRSEFAKMHAEITDLLEDQKAAG